MRSTKKEYSRLCSVGYVQTIPGVFSPGIALQRNSVSSVGYSYPYPELLDVPCARATIPGVRVHTAYFVPTRNFREFCTPMLQYPELLGLLELLYDFCTRTLNFWKFCKIPIPSPGTSVTSVRLWHNTGGTGVPLLQYPASSVLFQV